MVGHMTNAVCLYYAPDNASLCVRLLMERLELPFETILVDRRLKAQKDTDYLALNPNGLIPTIRTKDGTMFETGAILLWLADQQAGTVFPAVGQQDRGVAMTWMFWLSNTMHPNLRQIFYPDQYSSDTKDLRKRAKERAIRHLDIAEKACPILGTNDALACYLLPMLRWLQLYGGRPGWLTLERWPLLNALTHDFEQRQFAQRAAVAEGLGAYPFTQPEHPNPPEGSAL